MMESSTAQQTEAEAMDRCPYSQRVERAGTWWFDASSGEGFWSSTLQQILGSETSEGNALRLIEQKVHPADADAFAEICQTAMAQRTCLSTKLRILLPDGFTEVELHLLVQNTRCSREPLTSGSLKVLSEQSTNAGACSALSSLDTRLNELNHRNRNCFQLLLSCLTADQEHASHQEANKALSLVGQRIDALSEAYRLLETSAISSSSFSDYLEKLSRAAMRALAPRGANIQLKLDVSVSGAPQPTQFGLCGMVVVETITNVARRVLSSQKPINIEIVGHDAGDDSYELTLTNDDSSQQLGMAQKETGYDVVQSLARQLGGTLAKNPHDRNSLSLKFPLCSNESPSSATSLSSKSRRQPVHQH